jgi:glycosyltransferase involved in cell wall biosynthesis
MVVSKKKIAVLCNYELLPERVGGMDYFFWAFDKKCKENNIAVDWFFPNISAHGNYADLNIISSGKEEVALYFAKYIEIKAVEYSHIITHFVEICTPIFKSIKQISKANIIAVDHNPRPLGGYPILKKLKKRLKGFLYSKHIDLFVGVSAYTVKEIILDFGKQIEPKAKIIYNGVHLKDIQIQNHRNFLNPSFIVVSHLRKSKGIQDLIVAVSLLDLRIKEQLNISVYGDGPYKQELIKKVLHYDLKEIFRFRGSVSNLNELYCNYDYMLQPSYMECFSLSILESLAANVPVITTNVGGNEEVIKNGENGIIFKAKDITTLSQIITEIFKGEIKITANTRNDIEKNFSLEKMVENYYNLLN